MNNGRVPAHTKNPKSSWDSISPSAIAMAPRITKITKRILCESVGIWLRPLGNAALRSSSQGNGLVVKASDYSGLGFMGPGIFFHGFVSECHK